MHMVGNRGIGVLFYTFMLTNDDGTVTTNRVQKEHSLAVVMVWRTWGLCYTAPPLEVLGASAFKIAMRTRPDKS